MPQVCLVLLEHFFQLTQFLLLTDLTGYLVGKELTGVPLQIILQMLLTGNFIIPQEFMPMERLFQQHIKFHGQDRIHLTAITGQQGMVQQQGAGDIWEFRLHGADTEIRIVIPSSL